MKAALFALTVALVATPAWALDDKAICQAPSGSGYAWNGQVDACTRLLNGWSMTTEDRATTHFNRARAYYDGEQFSAAITDYSEAIRLDPGRATAWYSRGAVYSAMKIYTQAIANYDEAIRLNPSYANAYLNRGAAYALGFDNLEKAIEDFSAAIRLAPDNAQAWRNRSIAYSQLGDAERSAADAAEAARRGS